MFKIIVLQTIYNLGIEQQLFDCLHQELEEQHTFEAVWVRRRDVVLRKAGFCRAVFWIGMRNLAYNLGRLMNIPKRRAKGV